MWKSLRNDIAAVFDRDPAARSTIEVLLCYPGVHAIMMHRIAHWTWNHGMHLAARFLSHIARFFTGIEIHPAAKMGEGVFIDHGMAVVIGETSEVGDGCTFYQGATLGGTGHEKGKRHPTLGKNVTIGVGAKVLGNIAIGDNSLVGGGAVVLKPVPPNATAVGVPARVVMLEGRRIDPLEHGALPDPVAQQFRAMAERLEELEKRLRAIEERSTHPMGREV
jgi:serine O-acetyltransferase